jgi:hypothetical protein
VNDTTEALNKATEAARHFTNDAGTAFNTIAAGCSGMWDAGVSAAALAWDGKTTDALSVMYNPTLTCYDSVVSAFMGLFPFLS